MSSFVIEYLSIMTKEANPCESCRAACCRDISMNLTQDERDFLLSSPNTKLEFESWKFKNTDSYRVNFCGFLVYENGFWGCSVYPKNPEDEDPRPRCCKEYEAGPSNDLCGLRREKMGVYTPWDVPKLGFY
jgi:hypothetical protein